LQHLQTILGQNQSSEFFVLFEQKYILGCVGSRNFWKNFGGKKKI